MKEEKISIIVPVYNARKYIEECAKSVLSQTYVNWELVLVDDGSTDGSAVICDMVGGNDGRVKVIHQENQGVTKARRNGFFASSGQFIYFLDADDTLEMDALEYMISLFRDNIDIVVSDYRQDITFNWLEYSKLLLKHDLWAVFMKLYRRKLFDDYVFDTPSYFKCGEDFLMQLRILKNLTGSVLCVTANKYHYRRVAESVSHTFVPTMEYEICLMQEVEQIIRDLPYSVELDHAHFRFQTAYLGGMIGLQYPVPFKERWVTDIVNRSKKFKLNLHEYIAVKAVNYPCLRWVLIAEKKFRHFCRKYIIHK